MLRRLGTRDDAAGSPVVLDPDYSPFVIGIARIELNTMSPGALELLCDA